MANKTSTWVIAILAIGLVAICALFVVLSNGGFNFGSQSETISVSGNYEKEYMPDKVEVYIEIRTEDKLADEAKTKNSVISERVKKGLLAFVKAEDIETSSYYLGENQKWNGNTMTSEGYYVSNVLKVNVQDIEQVGKIIDTAISSGATSVQNVNFGFTKDKENEYKKEVLGEAAKEAKSKAEVLATSLGFKLGRIVNVGESNYYYGPVRAYAEDAMAKGNAGEMSFASTDINPQKVTIYATVSATYKLK